MPFRAIFRRLRHLSDPVSSLTLHFVWTTIPKSRQMPDCHQIWPGRDKEAMTASPKVKYKSIVRQLRRQQIENAALKAVLKHGFPGSTLRVVAREAKVPLSFAHYYFRDKEDLMRRVAERILARAIERLEQARGSERDPLRAARAFFFLNDTATTENRSALIAFVE